MHTLDDIKRLVAPVAERFGLERMWLFGSRARGDAEPDSDYDFRVIQPDGWGFDELYDFYTALEEALGGEIDVLRKEDFSGKRTEFSMSIARDEILIYDQHS